MQNITEIPVCSTLARALALSKIKINGIVAWRSTQVPSSHALLSKDIINLKIYAKRQRYTCKRALKKAARIETGQITGHIDTTDQTTYGAAEIAKKRDKTKGNKTTRVRATRVRYCGTRGTRAAIQNEATCVGASRIVWAVPNLCQHAFELA